MSEQSAPRRRADWPDPTLEVEPDRDDTSVETPLEDAAEQAAELTPGDEVPARHVPLDVDPADLADQAREVIDDEDEYR
jgi:hypothetical protein